MEETGENHLPVAVTDKLYHIMLYTSPSSRLELTTSVVIGTDCIGSCKSNNNTITATTAPRLNLKESAELIACMWKYRINASYVITSFAN